jgi:tRNA (adenine37-N6)-methyltransferase
VDKRFELVSIGVAHTPLLHRRDAPCQPGIQRGVAGSVEVFPAYAAGLADLEGFERVWLLYVFDRNEGFRLKVQPPRGPKHKRGLFATRSPHRPSPIGLTCARLVAIEGPRLLLEELDLLDGTPVVDIKPYIAAVDAFPAAREGWLAELHDDARSPKIPGSE